MKKLCSYILLSILALSPCYVQEEVEALAEQPAPIVTVATISEQTNFATTSSPQIHEVEVTDTNDTVEPVIQVDYAHEFFAAYNAGNYTITSSVPADVEWCAARDNYEDYIHTYNTDTYALINICTTTYYCNDGQYYISMNGCQPCYSVQELYDIDQTANNIANTIVMQLHDDTLSEYQQAEVYLNYVYSLDISSPPSSDIPVDAQDRIDRTIYNTPYSILVDKCGNCNAAAATYNLLMEYDGIVAYGLHVENHIVSYLLLDGQEYFCDWINHIGIHPIDELTDYYTLDNSCNLSYIHSL